MESLRQQTVLNRMGYSDRERVRRALDLLLTNRRHEFRELAITIVKGITIPIPWEEWDEFILSICLEVYDSFDVWTGKKEIEANSDLKTLIILRQLAKGRITMMQLTHLLNIAYYIASEFKVIYRHSR
ncbi:hypothetical protein [Nitrosopumilus sp. b1]|uniref:hypothetical protein n=1 Tax=Nitrosopumilus sp. b1 TaxID=2109907 RepID=UPI001C70C244|nr:hypothetical protein [Nitrosopumilus sp. b1]